MPVTYPSRLHPNLSASDSSVESSDSARDSQLEDLWVPKPALRLGAVFCTVFCVPSMKNGSTHSYPGTVFSVFVAIAGLCFIVVYFESSSSLRIHGADAMSQPSIAHDTKPSTLPQTDQAGASINEYASYMPLLEFGPTNLSMGIFEETSRAYVLQHVGLKGKETVLEFAPGGLCNLSHAKHWKICQPKAALQRSPDGFELEFPRRTIWGEDASHLVDRVLRVAWGPTPPRIDAVVRTGALAAFELSILLESMVVFWPRFIGEVIVVLDEADRLKRTEIIPERFAEKLRIRILYEPTPCLPGRIWNQISNPILADKYTDAPILAFLDSDMAFTAPVTPDLIFSATGVLIMHHGDAESSSFWSAWSDFFTAGNANKVYNSSEKPVTARLADYGHAMVTLPVLFHRHSMAGHRQYVLEASGGTCFQNRVSEMMLSPDFAMLRFCTICQMGVVIVQQEQRRASQKYHAVTDYTRQTPPYELIDPERRATVARYAVHVTYESGKEAKKDLKKYGDSASRFLRDGLCRAFGPMAFSGCAVSAVLDNPLEPLTREESRSRWRRLVNRIEPRIHWKQRAQANPQHQRPPRNRTTAQTRVRRPSRKGG